MKRKVLTVPLLVLVVLTTDAQIYQFRGPNRDGKFPESGVYTSNLLDNHHHGMIEVDGYLYGSYWVHNNAGNWACLDWNTGEVMFDEQWNSKGGLVYADGMFYVYEERRGNVALVQPDPSGFKVISSFRIEKGTGPHWSHPYILNGKLYLRHGDFLMIYSLT